MSHDFHRAYLVQLPLPLAQLYSRAFNAKDPRSRHDNTFYLFEALVKFTAAPMVAAYVQFLRSGGLRVDGLNRLLVQLALPSLGQWVGMVRELARYFAGWPDAPSQPLGHVWEQLGTKRQDLPAVLDLYRRIKNGPDGEPAGNQSCSLLELFDALVQYRNGVFGHGAGRFDSFYEKEMGPLLFPAANEILAEGVFDFMGTRGSKLVYLTELRTLEDGSVEVGLRELVGLQGERMRALTLPAAQAAPLAPQRVAILWPGRPVPLRLDPLLVYRESELADELLFLNRDRNGRQVEYLSYTTGRTERDPGTAEALAALFSSISGRPVTGAHLEALAQQSAADTPSVETLLGPETPAGRVVGDYEIRAEIGRGGMGVVYLARQLSLGRLVALKMLPADLASDAAALARFRREVQVLARCEHPNIVKVLSSGTLTDGQLYYAMEYVPGCNLEQVWQELGGDKATVGTSSLSGSTWDQAVLSASRKQRTQAASRSGPPKDATPASAEAPTVPGSPPHSDSPVPDLSLPPLPEILPAPDELGAYVRRVATLMRDVAEAVQAVHDRHLVHRDIKPANLMLTPDGRRVVLMDFGLAKEQSLALTASRQGGLLGTLRYAAPEQLAAATLKVGAPADIRGWGATFWELVTRKRLFASAQDEAQLAQMVHDQDVPLLRSVDPGIDRDLEAIVARATERRVPDRIQSARELAAYLQLYLEGRPLPIRPPTAREILWRWVRTHKVVLATVVSAAIAFLGAVITGLVLYNHAQNEESRRKAQDAVMALTRAFDAKLDHADWSVPSLQEMEAMLADLDRLDPEEAKAARQRFDQRLGESLRAELAQKRLSPEDIASLNASLDWLTERDPGLAAELKEALRKRSHAWEPLFTLAPPFAELDTVFDSGYLSLAPSSQFQPAALVPRSYTHSLVPTRVSCQGDLQFEAVFQSPWGNVSRIGLGLYDSQGHFDSIQGIAFSPDGKKLATGGIDQTVKVWDLSRSQVVVTLSGHKAQVNSVCFSSDGRSLASADADGEIKLWDTALWKERISLRGHRDYVNCVKFSPDGKLLASASGDKTAGLWDTASGVRKAVFKDAAVVEAVAFSPDGKTLATGNGEGLIGLWDTTTGKQQTTVKAYEKEIWSLVFAPDGRILASGSKDNTVKLWDTATWTEQISLQGHLNGVRGLAFSPDGRLLASGSNDETLKLWDVARGKLQFSVKADADSVRSVAFSPDGKILASAGSDPTVKLWDPLSGQESGRLQGRNYSFLLAVPPSATVGGRAAPPTLGQKESQEHTDAIKGVVFSPDGRRLVTCSDDRTIKVRNLSKGQVEVTLSGHANWINSVCFSPGGQLLASADADGQIKLWDTAGWKQRTTLQGHQDYVTCVVFSPDGKLLASASGDKTARLWDVASGEQKTILSVGTPVEAVAFSPDGKTLATGGRDGKIKLWDLPEGKQGPVFPAYENGVLFLLFSRDGKTLASAGEDGTVKLWNTADWKDPLTLRGHTDAVWSLAFAPDDSALASAGDDGTVRVWDRADGRQQALLETSSQWVRSVAFSPDGRMVAAGGGDPLINLWNVRDFSLAAAVRAGEKLNLQILRNGTILREEGVKVPPEMLDQPLHLTASLEDEQMIFQVNDLTPVRFDDVFPLRQAGSGVFSVCWPTGVRLEQLRAAQRTLAAESNPLEHGDEYYSRRQWAQALAQYEDQARVTTDPQTSQEARCKEALCLLNLQRQEDAAQRLQQLAGESGPRWPTFAAYQLWLIRLRQHRLEDANAILADLAARYDFEQIAPFVPEDIRKEILEVYRQGINYGDVTFLPSSVPDLQRLVKVQELFQASALDRRQAKHQMMRALHESGDLKQALAVGEELLNSSLPEDFRIDVLWDYVWLLLRTGEPQAALAQVEAWLVTQKSEYDKDFLPLLQLRSVIRSSLKQWDAAEKDMEEYFKRVSVDDDTSGFRAYLLLGFLRERRGDDKGAQNAWDDGYAFARKTPWLIAVEAVMLGSLSDDLNEQDAQEILKEMMLNGEFEPGTSTLQKGLLPPSELTPVIREMWRSRRGREFARKIAFLDLSYAEWNSIPAILFLAEFMHQGGFPGELSPEHDALIWNLAGKMHGDFAEGRLTEAQLLEGFLTWEHGFFGFSWSMASARLDPALRGPLAYVLGHRCLYLKKPAPAAKFFGVALADSPADSVLHRLAQSEVEQLNAK